MEMLLDSPRVKTHRSGYLKIGVGSGRQSARQRLEFARYCEATTLGDADPHRLSALAPSVNVKDAATQHLCCVARIIVIRFARVWGGELPAPRAGMQRIRTMIFAPDHQFAEQIPQAPQIPARRSRG